MADLRWTYEDASWNRKGVTLRADGLEWWESGHSFAGGGSCEQSFADFLREGPPVEDVPADVLAAVTEAVRGRLAGGA